MPATLELPTHVLAASLTDAGRKRALNEDAVNIQLTSYGGIFIVADGMGGHNAGEIASAIASTEVSKHLSSHAPSPKALLTALEVANHKIFLEGQNPDSSGMGTTCTTLWLDLPYALIAHVGDSRGYLLRGGQLQQITDDHSWVADRVRQGLLNEEEARNHRYRNVITNALGSIDKAKVDLVGITVEPGDVFLLCSDGLTTVLEDQVIRDVLFSNPPQEAAQQLIDLANEWGGPDNISVAIAVVGSLPSTTKTPEYAMMFNNQPGVIKFGFQPLDTLTTGEQPHQDAGNKGLRLRFRWQDYLLVGLLLGIVLFVLIKSFVGNTDAAPLQVEPTLVPNQGNNIPLLPDAPEKP